MASSPSLSVKEETAWRRPEAQLCRVALLARAGSNLASAAQLDRTRRWETSAPKGPHPWPQSMVKGATSGGLA